MKHIPFPGRAIIQYITLMALPCLVIPFAKTMGFPMLAIPLTAIAAAWAADLVIFILSFTIWWNKPLWISQEGMAKGKGPICRYEDAVAFSFKKGLPSQYGRGNGIMTIRYKNGESICFEYNKAILKTINRVCQDQTFLAKLRTSSE